MSRKRVCDAAVEILRETDNPAVMWGDAHLLHLIAERSGMNANAWITEKRVLDALTRQPGVLVPKLARAAHGRVVRIFRLPEPAAGRKAAK